MTCTKCQGLVVLVYVHDENEKLQAGQCVNCSKMYWLNKGAKIK